MMWLLLTLLPALLSGRPCPAGECAKDHLLLQHRHDVQKVNHKMQAKASVHLNVTKSKKASIVEEHGRLGVIGNKVVGEHGNPVRLRGMSLFWSQWKPQFWTQGTVQWLKEDWGITLLRCPMAVEAGGYLENPEAEQAKIEVVVDAAIQAGIYVIIDWHDHAASHAEHTPAALGFFKEMSQKYGQYPNVMFEVFNEPIYQNWTLEIKPYHEQVVQVIREHTNNLVILGTRKWSQEVAEAARDPVDGANLAYTIHFYANTHKQDLRQKVIEALEAGVAIFATEWGTCDASGDGTLNLEETKTWLEFFEEHHISDANWAVSDKQEACSALLPGADGAGQWQDCELTLSGHFVRASLRGEAPPSSLPTPCPRLTTPPPGQCAPSGEDCSEKKCCEELGKTCYRKNEYWAACRDSCIAGTAYDDPPWNTTWSCEELARVPEALNTTTTTSAETTTISSETTTTLAETTTTSSDEAEVVAASSNDWTRVTG